MGHRKSDETLVLTVGCRGRSRSASRSAPAPALASASASASALSAASAAAVSWSRSARRNTCREERSDWLIHRQNYVMERVFFEVELDILI